MTEYAAPQTAGGKARGALALGIVSAVLYFGGGFAVGGVFWLLGPLVGIAAIVLGIAARRDGRSWEAIVGIALGVIPVLWFAIYMITAGLD